MEESASLGNGHIIDKSSAGEVLADLAAKKEEFAGQVKLALANVLQEYRGQTNLLRPKVNACLEEHFGVRSREVNLQIADDSQSFSVQFRHPLHGDIALEA